MTPSQSIVNRAYFQMAAALTMLRPREPEVISDCFEIITNSAPDQRKLQLEQIRDGLKRKNYLNADYLTVIAECAETLGASLDPELFRQIYYPMTAYVTATDIKFKAISANKTFVGRLRTAITEREKALEATTDQDSVNLELMIRLRRDAHIEMLAVTNLLFSILPDGTQNTAIEIISNRAHNSTQSRRDLSNLFAGPMLREQELAITRIIGLVISAREKLSEIGDYEQYSFTDSSWLGFTLSREMGQASREVVVT